jgi:hypothetical protein
VLTLLDKGMASMQAFSATSAISPAIDRTKHFLFRNIRFGTFLKLCLVAVLTEGGGGSFNFRIPAQHYHSPATPGIASLAPFFPFGSFHLTPALFVVILAFATLVLAVGLVIAYLITRLRFAYFHCLIHGSREIRPGWRIYDEQSWRYFLLSLAVGFTFFVLVLLLAAPFILGFIRFFHASQAGQGFNIAGFLALFLPLIPVLLLIVVLAIVINIVLRDFMLPHIALENATCAVAWRAVRQRIAAEKGGFCLYAILRIFLPLAAGIAAVFVLLIPMLIMIGIGAVIAIAFHSLMAKVAGVTLFLLILLAAVLIAAAIAAAIVMILAVGGTVGTWTRNYALLFYGGRYQALGDILSPPPARESPSLPA